MYLWFGWVILCITVPRAGWKVRVVAWAVYLPVALLSASPSHLLFPGWETTGGTLRVPNYLGHPDLPGAKLEGERECRCFLPCCNMTGHSHPALKHWGTWLFCACPLHSFNIQFTPASFFSLFLHWHLMTHNYTYDSLCTSTEDTWEQKGGVAGPSPTSFLLTTLSFSLAAGCTGILSEQWMAREGDEAFCSVSTKSGPWQVEETMIKLY